MKAGHCVVCDTNIFRGVHHPGTGAWYPLWPDPTSVYAQIVLVDDAGASHDGWIPGVAYCAEHAPAVGDPAPADVVAQQPTARFVAAVETALERYTKWYADDFGAWLTAWIPEQCKVDPAAWLTQWAEDRQRAIRPDERKAREPLEDAA